MGSSHALISLLVWSSSGNWTSHKLSAWLSLRYDLVCVRQIHSFANIHYVFDTSCMYLFTASYGVSYGPIAWVLASELFPLSMRSKGVAISTASNWINNCQ